LARIIIHDYAGHPFQVQLSRELAGRGHEIRHLYCESTHTPRGEMSRRGADPASFVIRGIALSQTIPKTNFVRRFRLESEYARLLAAECERFRPEVVLSANTPSIAQYQLANWCGRRGVRLVSWVQDVYGVAAYRLLGRKLPLVGHVVGKYFITLDKSSARRSDAIVVITPDFRDLLVKWGIDAKRIHVIHNWAPLADISLRPRENAWSNEHLAPSGEHVAAGHRFLYSGTLAMKHNPALLLELARLLQREAAGELIVCSEGAGVEWLAEQAAAEKISTVRCLGFQPFEVFADVLGSADVLVAILEPDAGVYSVPSKVLSYFAAGRPVLLAVPSENLAAQIVVESGAGIVVEPTDISAFCRAAKELLDSPKTREKQGAAGRRYAEAHFDIGLIGDQFEAILAG
jgi:colanic acid biosynthesis glycosyl transferase WcaI